MTEYQCGCHLNHSSAHEHVTFWQNYKAKRKQEREKKQRRRQPPKTKAAKRRAKIREVLGISVLRTGKEPRSKFAGKRQSDVARRVARGETRHNSSRRQGRTQLSMKEYLKSADWEKKREAAFAMHGRKCEHCGATDKLGVMRRHFATCLMTCKIEALKIACARCRYNIQQGYDPVEGRSAIDREFSRIVK
jgi:hypothetical protein